MGAKLGKAKSLLKNRKRDALETYGCDDIEIIDELQVTKRSPLRQTKQDEDLDAGAQRNTIDKGTTFLDEDNYSTSRDITGEPDSVGYVGEPGAFVEQSHEDLFQINVDGETQVLMDMYNLLQDKIAKRTHGTVLTRKYVTVSDATPPCIDAILGQQSAVYEMMIKLKQENESSQQIQELVQLGERFFKQMKKDNLEIKQYLAEKARSKNEQFITMFKQMEHERLLKDTHDKKEELVNKFRDAENDDLLIQELLETKHELDLLQRDYEMLQENENEKLERMELEVHRQRDIIETQNEEIGILHTQVQVNETQMKYELENKIVTINHMEDEIVMLSERLIKMEEKDDLTEVGHYLISEVRERQLIVHLEDTKAQLLETMDELEEVADALHRESIHNRELQQLIAIKDEKIRLLKLTIDEIRSAYEQGSQTSISLNIVNKPHRAFSMDTHVDTIESRREGQGVKRTLRTTSNNTFSHLLGEEKRFNITQHVRPFEVPSNERQQALKDLNLEEIILKTQIFEKGLSHNKDPADGEIVYE